MRKYVAFLLITILVISDLLLLSPKEIAYANTKPVEQMTDAERDEFLRGIYKNIASNGWSSLNKYLEMKTPENIEKLELYDDESYDLKLDFSMKIPNEFNIEPNKIYQVNSADHFYKIGGWGLRKRIDFDEDFGFNNQGWIELRDPNYQVAGYVKLSGEHINFIFTENFSEMGNRQLEFFTTFGKRNLKQSIVYDGIEYKDSKDVYVVPEYDDTVYYRTKIKYQNFGNSGTFMWTSDLGFNQMVEKGLEPDLEAMKVMGSNGVDYTDHFIASIDDNGNVVVKSRFGSSTENELDRYLEENKDKGFELTFDIPAKVLVDEVEQFEEIPTQQEYFYENIYTKEIEKKENPEQKIKILKKEEPEISMLVNGQTSIEISRDEEFEFTIKAKSPNEKLFTSYYSKPVDALYRKPFKLDYLFDSDIEILESKLYDSNNQLINLNPLIYSGRIEYNVISLPLLGMRNDFEWKIRAKLKDGSTKNQYREDSRLSYYDFYLENWNGGFGNDFYKSSNKVIINVKSSQDLTIYKVAGDKESVFVKPDEKLPEIKETLEGATFQLIDDNEKLYKEVTTDKNGKAEIKNIPLGKYTIKEVEAPEGYELDDKVYPVTFQQEGKYSFIAYNKEDVKELTDSTKGDAKGEVYWELQRNTNKPNAASQIYLNHEFEITGYHYATRNPQHKLTINGQTYNGKDKVEQIISSSNTKGKDVEYEFSYEYTNFYRTHKDGSTSPDWNRAETYTLKDKIKIDHKQKETQKKRHLKELLEGKWNVGKSHTWEDKANKKEKSYYETWEVEEGIELNEKEKLKTQSKLPIMQEKLIYNVELPSKKHLEENYMPFKKNLSKGHYLTLDVDDSLKEQYANNTKYNDSGHSYEFPLQQLIPTDVDSGDGDIRKFGIEFTTDMFVISKHTGLVTSYPYVSDMRSYIWDGIELDSYQSYMDKAEEMNKRYFESTTGSTYIDEILYKDESQFNELQYYYLPIHAKSKLKPNEEYKNRIVLEDMGLNDLVFDFNQVFEFNHFLLGSGADNVLIIEQRESVNESMEGSHEFLIDNGKVKEVVESTERRNEQRLHGVRHTDRNFVNVIKNILGWN